ncbi:protein FAM47E-like [Elephas maximus indicus]|uniref:protein FAM47E-like n=1 Tax=Elephas maximus indicus TaxID=99487 RepID=UPI0021165799|nr:protein FAM47E-like [Elephas maximus indicus]
MAHQRRRSRPVALEPMPPGMNCKPWYKDRLPSKYFAKSKDRPKFPTSLNSRSWVFVREGLDDFRRGCPPCGEMIIRGPKESCLPVIYPTTPRAAPKSCRKKLSKESALFSKLSPAQIARKAFVEDTEAHLRSHPLASYLDLEDEMPVELLQKVLEVLDPDKKLEDTWAYCQDGRKRTKQPKELLKNRSTKVFLNLPKVTPVPNPDDWLEEIQESIEDLPEAPPIPENISTAVADFCEWVATFECTGVDEEFVLNKFDLCSDCKPKLGSPKIKDIILVPPEIKYSEGLSKKAQPKFSLPEPDVVKKLHDLETTPQKKHVKMRYGAWYLKPKLWKKLREDEPLLDPNAENEVENAYFRKDRKEYDILAELYGTIAFKDFILNKGYTMPSLIERVFMKKGWRYDTTKTPTVLSTRNSSSGESSEED